MKLKKFFNRCPRCDVHYETNITKCKDCKFAIDCDDTHLNHMDHDESCLLYYYICFDKFSIEIYDNETDIFIFSSKRYFTINFQLSPKITQDRVEKYLLLL